MKVKEMMKALEQLDPEMEIIGFAEDGDKFDDAKRTYLLKELKQVHAFRERERINNVDATLRFHPEGSKQVVLYLTSDF
ncbi:hypothetical protein L9W97_11590 [Vibrio aestuarianus]|uniref:hypothetical protein n=1 Tax=Vibrio aestuarianus TaxID=28171 RepID=UPI00155936BD|nr:hypothetical protein [Vibrio aestuarianus]MDE1238849.1 hypothetical protein [Vibrio aestuarianus]MDE1325775.1 hypothetical protein [Vibrio aestuarianus]MDE1339981.1 hypothetical protein [Vibrio aestuarianus]NGZ12793.1 hypothetical protein [Vibrio aestuarianus]NKZ48941.1 hypothetical protein [Vibrio aestuarianus]